MEPVLLTRDSSAGPETLDAYRESGGYEALLRARASSPRSVLDAVIASGLRGRGGAGFPAGRKWDLAAAEQATPKYVVANGGEDEPGSEKDRLLMERYAHKVVEGVALAACAISASEAVLYVNARFDRAIAGLETAIAEATSRRPPRRAQRRRRVRIAAAHPSRAARIRGGRGHSSARGDRGTQGAPA